MSEQAGGPRRWWRSIGEDPTPLNRSVGYVAAVVVILTLSGLLRLVRGDVDPLTIGLVYLLAVLLIALAAGAGAATAAAVLSFLLFNVLFIPPYGTLDVGDPENLVALIAYLAVATVIGQLVARVRQRTAVAEREGRRTALLYELNAALIGDVTLDAILLRITERVVTVYGARAGRVLLPGADEQLEVRAAYPKEGGANHDRQSLAIAAWAIEHRQPAGRSSAGRRIRANRGQTAALPSQDREEDVLYVPIATRDRAIGVLEVTGRPGGGRFAVEDERLLTSFANQAALALERTRLTEEAARAEVLARSDELKTALLSAVSHDLRTPLAAIKASATALLDGSVRWDEASRQEFLTAIDEETDRLTMVVSNLLDLSRIEGGALRPDRDWYDVDELIADVAARIAPRATRHEVTADVEPGIGLLWFDYVEIAQVLLNLCENALKYTQPGTPIQIGARRRPNAVELWVKDRGPGIPAPQAARLFEKFYRGDSGGTVPGTGIGLTISKGLVEAHGGRIWVESQPSAGTTVRFTIPMTEDEHDGG